MQKESGVTLEKVEERVLCEFLEMHLFSAIRDDREIDNMNWLVTIVGLFKRMAEDCGYVGLTYPAGEEEDEQESEEYEVSE